MIRRNKATKVAIALFALSRPRSALSFSNCFLKAERTTTTTTTSTTTLAATIRYPSFLSQTTRLFFASISDSNSSTSNEITMSSEIAANLESVKQSMQQAAEKCNRDVSTIRLVAVSKTKPIELLQNAYDAGQRVFGENYAQELIEKANHFHQEKQITDIHWHFIGTLQSNKANLLVKSIVPNTDIPLTIETVASLKLAKKLNNAMDEFKPKILKVFLQVNTSGEESKSGVTPEEVTSLYQEIVKECPYIQIQGLMTIGAPGDESCLDCLAKCRQEILDTGITDKVELSMGMSGDYQVAIAKGSTNIRVGSTIFGERDYGNK